MPLDPDSSEIFMQPHLCVKKGRFEKLQESSKHRKIRTHAPLVRLPVSLVKLILTCMLKALATLELNDSLKPEEELEDDKDIDDILDTLKQDDEPPEPIKIGLHANRTILISPVKITKVRLLNARPQIDFVKLDHFFSS